MELRRDQETAFFGYFYVLHKAAATPMDAFDMLSTKFSTKFVDKYERAGIQFSSIQELI